MKNKIQLIVFPFCLLFLLACGENFEPISGEGNILLSSDNVDSDANITVASVRVKRFGQPGVPLTFQTDKGRSYLSYTTDMLASPKRFCKLKLGKYATFVRRGNYTRVTTNTSSARFMALKLSEQELRKSAGTSCDANCWNNWFAPYLEYYKPNDSTGFYVFKMSSSSSYPVHTYIDCGY